MKTEEIKDLALAALDDLKALEIVVLDVRELTDLTDYMIICTGRSNRHVHSLAFNVLTAAKAKHLSYIRMEGEREAEWIVVDLGDVVIHVMQAATREFYNLEELWEPHAHSHSRHRE